eukprot:gene8128-biopygen14515
MSRGGCSRP